MVLVKSAPAWRGGPISVRSGARRRHRDPVPHHPARLVAGEGRVTASSRRSVLEAALHAELLARPGRIDVGLAIEGEEVSLVLELAEQCPGVWPLSAACDLPGGVGRATWGSAQRAKLLPAFGRGYGTALGRALASALSINVRRSGRRLRVAAAGLLALNTWLTSRTVCSSAATSRAVARHERARRRRRDYHRLAAPSRPVAAAAHDLLQTPTLLIHQPPRRTGSATTSPDTRILEPSWSRVCASTRQPPRNVTGPADVFVSE